MENLRAYLAALSPGNISSASNVGERLRDSWDQIQGGDGSGMSANDLVGAMEAVRWNPPILSFTIERHWRIIGAGRTEIYVWEVNVETAMARSGIVGLREPRLKQTPLDLGILVDETVRSIIGGSQHPHLFRNQDGSVVIDIGKMIASEGVTLATVNSWRKRFRDMLAVDLKKVGWNRVGADRYTANK